MIKKTILFGLFIVVIFIVYASGPETDNIVKQQSLSPDISWTFTTVIAPNGYSSLYRLAEFRPPDANLAIIGELNPAIPLIIGKRYRITIKDPVHHPFEIIAKGITLNHDKPLLSQGALKSPFENDPNIAWIDVVGTVTFTLTPELAEAMNNPDVNQVPGYSCQKHSFSERGTFKIDPNNMRSL